MRSSLRVGLNDENIWQDVLESTGAKRDGEKECAWGSPDHRLNGTSEALETSCPSTHGILARTHSTRDLRQSRLTRSLAFDGILQANMP
jgi:hypothetical protein